MPTYPVIHRETKEKKELSMTMKAYDQWRKDKLGEDYMFNKKVPFASVPDGALPAGANCDVLTWIAEAPIATHRNH